MPLLDPEFRRRAARYAVGLLCCAALGCVLWTRPGLRSVTGTDKMLFLFFLLPALTLAAGSILLLEGKKKRVPAVRPLDIVIAAGTVLLVLNYHGLGGVAAGKLAVVLSLLLFYCDLRVLLWFTPALKQALTATLLILVNIEILWGILQLYGCLPSYHGLFKITGSLLNPGPYAGYVAALAPLAIYRLAVPGPKKGWLDILCWAAVLGSVVILPSTESRTAWVALAAATVFLIFREKKWGPKIQAFCRRHKTAAIFGAVALAGAAGATVFALYSLKPVSADGRLLMWKVSGRVIAAHPWFGVGFGNFRGAYAGQQAAYFAAGERPLREQMAAGSPDYAFNDLLQTGAELGLVGLGLFLAAVILALRGLWAQRNGLLYSAIALLVFSLASYPLNLSPFGVLAVFLAAASVTPATRTASRRSVLQTGWAICLTAALAFHLGALRYGIRYDRAVRQWDLFRPAYQQGGRRSIWAEYEKTDPILTDDSDFVREYAACLLEAGKTDPAYLLLHSREALLNDPADFILQARACEARSDTTGAEFYLKKAMWHSPGRIHAPYLLADYYCRHGRGAQGAELARRTLERPSKTLSAQTKRIRQKLQQIIDDYQSK